MATQKTYSGQDIADALGVQGIQLRRYIRSDGTRVGRGRTYKFSADEARQIAEGYAQTRQKEDLSADEKALIAEALALPAPEVRDHSGERG